MFLYLQNTAKNVRGDCVQWKTVIRNSLKVNLLLLETLSFVPRPMLTVLLYCVYKKPPHLRNHLVCPFRFLITDVHCTIWVKIIHGNQVLQGPPDTPWAEGPGGHPFRLIELSAKL